MRDTQHNVSNLRSVCGGVIRSGWHEPKPSIYVYLYCKHNLLQTKLMALTDDKQDHMAERYRSVDVKSYVYSVPSLNQQ